MRKYDGMERLVHHTEQSYFNSIGNPADMGLAPVEDAGRCSGDAGIEIPPCEAMRPGIPLQGRDGFGR